MTEGNLPHYETPEELLPTYEPTHSFFGVTLLKTEFITPYQNNIGDRGWKPVILELNLTQLNMYELAVDKKCTELILSLYNESNSLEELLESVLSQFKPKIRDEDDVDAYSVPDMDAHQQYQIKHSYLDRIKNKKKHSKQTKSLSNIDKYYDILKDNQMLFEPCSSQEKWGQFKEKYRGRLIRSYTLANLRAGEAPNLRHLISQLFQDTDGTEIPPSTLIKYKNTLRVRLEYRQVLLQFWSFTAMTNWYRALEIGHDLSMPLEERTSGKLKTIPRRNTSRNNELLTAMATHVEEYERESSVEKESIDEFCVEGLAGDSPSSGSASPSLDILETMSDRSRQSSTSMISDGLAKIPSSKTTTEIKKKDFISFENWNTPLQKQYISNCIPKLNSFDRWHGKTVTLSNFSHFAGLQNIQQDVYINPHELATADAKTIDFACRSFYIHSSGLVSIKK